MRFTLIAMMIFGMAIASIQQIDSSKDADLDDRKKGGFMKGAVYQDDLATFHSNLCEFE